MLALRKVPEFNAESVIIIMGTGAKRRPVKLKPILTRQAALPGCYALIGAYIAGHIQRKRKPTYFETFLKAPDEVISALCGIRVRAYPSDQVPCGYEYFCVCFSTILL